MLKLPIKTLKSISILIIYKTILIMGSTSLLAQTERIENLQDSLEKQRLLYSEQSIEYQKTKLSLGQEYLNYFIQSGDQSFLKRGYKIISDYKSLDTIQILSEYPQLEQNIEQKGINYLWMYSYILKDITTTSSYHPAKLHLGKLFLKYYLKTTSTKPNLEYKKEAVYWIQEYYLYKFKAEGFPPSIYQEAHKLAPLYKTQKGEFYAGLLWEIILDVQFPKSSRSDIDINKPEVALAYLRTLKAIEVVGREPIHRCDSWAPNLPAPLFIDLGTGSFYYRYSALASIFKANKSIEKVEAICKDFLTIPLRYQLQQLAFEQKYQLFYFSQKMPFSIDSIAQHPMKESIIQDLIDLAKQTQEVSTAIKAESICSFWSSLQTDYDYSCSRAPKILSYIRVHLDILELSSSLVQELTSIFQQPMPSPINDNEIVWKHPNLYNRYYELFQDIKHLQNNQYNKTGAELVELLRFYKYFKPQEENNIYEEGFYFPISINKKELFQKSLEYQLSTASSTQNAYLQKTMTLTLEEIDNIFDHPFYQNLLTTRPDLFPQALLRASEAALKINQFIQQQNIDLSAKDFLHLIEEYLTNYNELLSKAKTTNNYTFQNHIKLPYKLFPKLSVVAAQYLDARQGELSDSMVIAITNHFIEYYPKYTNNFYAKQPFYEYSYLIWEEFNLKQRGEQFIIKNPNVVLTRLQKILDHPNRSIDSIYKILLKELPHLEYQLSQYENKYNKELFEFWEQQIAQFALQELDPQHFFADNKSFINYLSLAILDNQLNYKSEAQISEELQNKIPKSYIKDIRIILEESKLKASKEAHAFFWIRNYPNYGMRSVVPLYNYKDNPSEISTLINNGQKSASNYYRYSEEEILRLKSYKQFQDNLYNSWGLEEKIQSNPLDIDFDRISYSEKKLFQALEQPFSKESSALLKDSLEKRCIHQLTEHKYFNAPSPIVHGLKKLFEKGTSLFSQKDQVLFLKNLVAQKSNYNDSTARYLEVLYFNLALKLPSSVEELELLKQAYLDFLSHQPNFWEYLSESLKDNIWTTEEIDLFLKKKIPTNTDQLFNLDHLTSLIKAKEDYLQKQLEDSQGDFIYTNKYREIILSLIEISLEIGLTKRIKQYLNSLNLDPYQGAGREKLGLAKLYYSSKNYEKVIAYGNEVLEINQFQYIDPKIKFDALALIARSYKALEEYNLYLKYLNKATEFAKKEGYSTHLALDWGIYYSETLEFEKAKSFFQIALDSAQNKGQLIETYYQLAYWSSYNNKLVQAEQHYLSMLDLIHKRLKYNYLNIPEEDRSDLLNVLKPKINEFNRFATAHPSKAMTKALVDLHFLLKGIGLENSSNIQRLILNSENVALKNEWKELQNLKKKAALASTLTIEEQNKQNLDPISLYLSIQKQKEKISNASQALRNYFKQENTEVTFSEIKQSLDEKTVAIDFIIINKEGKIGFVEDYYYAILISKNQDAPQLIELCSVEDLNFSLEMGVQPNNINYISDALESYYVYQMVFQPLEPYLKGYKTLNLCPTGGLSKIAFGTLVSSDYSNTRLMDQYDIHYYISLRDLEQLEQSDQKDKKVMLVGGVEFTLDKKQLAEVASNKEIELNVEKINQPKQKDRNVGLLARAQSRGEDFTALPGTLKEVDKIQSLFTKNEWSTTKLTGLEALEEDVVKVAEKEAPTILHIATHGFFFAKEAPETETDQQKQRTDKSVEKRIASIDDPLLRSGLALTGVNQVWKGGEAIEGLEDGIFTALEVSNMDLSKTELVVLSACETARGDIDANEGVMGLQRAFKMAGAQRLIISLWKVPDAQTAELMELFYQNYLAGQEVQTAFKNAQAEMRQRYQNPYYWAAFILIE
jgi:CHAT domain-containing protein